MKVWNTVLLATLTGLLLAPLLSEAWEQTESDLGYPLAWTSSCFHYSINAAGSDDVAFDDLVAIAREAFDTWEDVDCAYFYFVATDPAFADEQAFHEDRGNTNLLVWRESEATWAYGPLVVGLTSVHFDPASGEVRDVDIEFNGHDFEFGTLDEYPEGSPLIDLRSTLTHEIGHSIGLAHSDVDGATMFPYGDPGSTEKRSLEQDDIDGLCHIYPISSDPDVCEEPWCGLDLTGDSTECEMDGGDGGEDCGCVAVGAQERSGSVLLNLLVTLLDRVASSTPRSISNLLKPVSE